MTDQQLVARYQAFLWEVGDYIREDALEARDRVAKDRADTSTPEHDPSKMFHLGGMLSYYSLVSWMQQVAEPFGIPLEELALQDIDPDRDLT